MKTLEESVKEQLGKELDKWFPSKQKQSARRAAVTLTGAFIIELRKVLSIFRNCPYCKICEGHKKI